MRRLTTSQKRKRQKDIVGIIIMVLLGTPVLAMWVVWAALLFSGCADPGVICSFNW